MLTAGGSEIFDIQSYRLRFGHILWPDCWVLIHQQPVFPQVWPLQGRPGPCSEQAGAPLPAGLPEAPRHLAEGLTKPPTAWGWGRRRPPSADAEHLTCALAGSSGWKPAACPDSHPCSSCGVFSSGSWLTFWERAHLWSACRVALCSSPLWWPLPPFRWSGHDWWKRSDLKWPGPGQPPLHLHSAPGRKARRPSEYHPATLVPSHYE